jgi:site-specific DNA-cytosine methylase
MINKKVSQINPNKESGGKQPYQQNRIYDTDGISPALCANKSDLLINTGQAGLNFGFKQNSKAATILQRDYKGMNNYGINVVVESERKHFEKLSKGDMVRRLTPIECERLQTVADNYTNHVSDSQRYKMLGNGWTISVISHIFSYLKTQE